MSLSKYPPSQSYPEVEKLENDIALYMAMGVPFDEIEDNFLDEFEIEDEWELARGDEPKPDDLNAVIEEVAAEYRRVVPEPSEDARKFEQFKCELEQRRIAFSFGEGFDRHEAAVEGAELAETLGFDGYAYCHLQDVARLITDGKLYIGFYSLDLEDDEAALAVGHKVMEALTAAGFTPEWDATLDARIELGGIRWEIPLNED